MPVKPKVPPKKLSPEALVQLAKNAIKSKANPIKEELLTLSGTLRCVRLVSTTKGFLVVSSKGNHHLPKYLGADSKHAEKIFNSVVGKLKTHGAKKFTKDAVLLDL